ncbi:metal-dependent transcriptional regulator (plasmid) [Lactobacillus plantarum] [Lactiplantibacillus mudanjiangensis]|uniref:metal-dependent transcriptional regulator n=1 Tax=Lactiplantibacillus mudanjiangensis TaxID=1296538 RepID=UPI001014D6EE|nr:metal-dependent transcriptional regulator [Lactiplantibacillus mudanjiangensis]VDG33807.1 metal-dependent transcriptional regulator (plasmid) [Lactobacillus plantarum] [Lactiplantibacillus mudanjiangensis]
MRKSVANYLKAIYEASYLQGGTSNKQIAELLQVAAGSVTEMVSYLADEGLVQRQKYGQIQLSQNGMKKAWKLIYRYRLFEVWLSEVLKLPLLKIPTQAWHLATANDELLISRLNMTLAEPQHSPFGGCIHTPNEQPVQLQPLIEAQKTQFVTIHSYLEQPDMIQYFDYAALHLGQKLQLIDKNPDLQVIALQDADGHKYLLNWRLARYIYVVNA